MSAPVKVPLAVAAGGTTVRVRIPLELLTAAMFELGDRLAGADDTEAAELALMSMLGIGGIDLAAIAEAVVLASWADELDASEVTRWDACAERVKALFGTAATSGAEVS